MGMETKTPEMTMELRTLTDSSFEIREQEDGGKYIEGYAMKWEQLSQPLGWFSKFREKFKKGAFRDYLSGSNTDTKFLIGHNISQVLGRKKNNTLELSEDDKGLFFRLTLPDTTAGIDTYKSVKRGDVDKISVGFTPLQQEWDETDEEDVKRTITKANLPEISLTAWPAYEQTSASARSIDEAYKEYRAVKEESVPEAEADKLAEQRKGFNKLKSKIYQAYEEVK
jgi:uncharacterized protein